MSRKSLEGRRYGIRNRRSEPRLEVYELPSDAADSKAVEIVVAFEKPRCPFCGSHRCLHNKADAISDIVAYGEYIGVITPSNCLGKKHQGRLFLVEDCQRAQQATEHPTLMCQRCPSKNLELKGRFRLRLRTKREDMNEKYIEWARRIELGTPEVMFVRVYLCKQCKILNALYECLNENGEQLRWLESCGIGKLQYDGGIYRMYYDVIRIG